MKFILTVDMDNASFDDMGIPFQMEKIFNDIVTKLHIDSSCGQIRKVMDINGNTVGSWIMEEEQYGRVF